MLINTHTHTHTQFSFAFFLKMMRGAGAGFPEDPRLLGIFAGEKARRKEV